MLYVPIWVSGADFEKDMEFWAKEGSNVEDFCQEIIVFVSRSATTRSRPDTKKS